MHFFDIGLNLRKRGSFFNLTDSSKFKIKYNLYNRDFILSESFFKNLWITNPKVGFELMQ